MMTMTLDDYRACIKEAVDSQQLAMLLYRALPLAYVEMGLVKRAEDVRDLNVELQLTRHEETWKLWFNIRGEYMIKVLNYLDSEMFNRMSGGGANASAITTGMYGKGFQQTTTPFVVEQTFVEQEVRLTEALSKQTSVDAYWDTLMEAAPVYLARSLGWVSPNSEQNDYLLRRSKPFQELCTPMCKKITMCNGAMTNKGDARASLDVSSIARTSLEYAINSVHHPILQGCPFFEIRSAGVRGYYLQKVAFSSTTEALVARAQEETMAYCLLHDTKTMPIYALNESLRFERAAMPEMPYADFNSSL